MFRLFGQDLPIKSAVLVFSEMALLGGTIIFATWVRLGDPDSFHGYVGQEYFIWKLSTVLAVCFICFYYNDLYDLHTVSKRWELVIRLMQALGAASIILAVVYYIFPDLMLGRGVFAIAAVAGAAVLITWRLFVDASVTYFRPEQRVLIAGTGIAGLRLIEELKSHPELNLRIVGVLSENGTSKGSSFGGTDVIGHVKEIEQLAGEEKADCVVLSLAERRGQMPVQQLLRLKVGGVIRVEDAHTMYERLTGRIMLDKLSPSALIFSDGFKKTVLERLTKRGIDASIAAIGLIVSAPIMLMTALAIYIESGAPILFRQRRIGYKGREFDMLKFRSMRQDSDKGEAKWASQQDSRITRVGKFIRRYRIDEMPQFLNVLRGDMALIGPRPEQPLLAQMLEEKIPFYPERHAVRPGITGWAQIRFQYGASIEDAKTKLEYDLFYIKHLSPLFDLAIAFRTFQVMFFGRGAV